MAGEEAASDIDIHGLSVDDAFALLGDETRVGIVLALWRARAMQEYDDVILDRKAAAPGPMDAIDVWRMGGQIGHSGDMAYNWADKEYLIVAEANWEDFDTAAQLEWVRETERRLRDAGGVGSYAGFTGVEEQAWEDWADQVYGENYERLADVTKTYDPENVFRHNVTVHPGE